MLPLFAKLVPAHASACKCSIVRLFLWRFVTHPASNGASWCFLPQASRADDLLAFLAFIEANACPQEVARTLQRPAAYTFLTRRIVMLYWAAVFFVIALLAAVFGFGGLAASAAGVAKILFFVFLVFAVVSFLFGRRSPA